MGLGENARAQPKARQAESTQQVEMKRRIISSNYLNIRLKLR
jgi:hypothetical protein